MADISRPSGGNLPHKEQTRAELPPTTLMGKQKQAIAGLAGACNARAEGVHWDGITMAQFPMPVKMSGWRLQIRPGGYTAPTRPADPTPQF